MLESSNAIHEFKLFLFSYYYYIYISIIYLYIFVHKLCRLRAVYITKGVCVCMYRICVKVFVTTKYIYLCNISIMYSYV